MTKVAALYAWRARMGWSQRRAAAEMGVFLSTYQQWELGISRQTGEQVDPPRHALLAAAALEAGVPLIS